MVSVAAFNGGGALNVTPDSVTIGGTFRAFSNDSFYKLRQREEEVILGQAAVHRCTAVVDFFEKRISFILQLLMTRICTNMYIELRLM